MPLIIQNLSSSVVLRITSLMISVILMAFISIFSSMYMSQISEYDGKTINLSGSLRMMSYRITTQVATVQQSPTPENRQKVRQLIDRFETLFNDPVLKKDFIRFHEVRLQREYEGISTQWHQVIKPTLAGAGTRFDLERFLPVLEKFVNSINSLVYGYQLVLEERLSHLKIIQSVTLSVTLILIFLSIYTIHRHIARPLRELTAVAEASSNGDWSKRSSVERQDELGLLSRTLNKANESIQAIHRDLEQRIEEKTQALSRNNEILTFLYQVAQQVNESHHDRLKFQEIIEMLSEVSHLNKIELRLYSEHPSLPYQEITVDRSATPEESAVASPDTSPTATSGTQVFMIERNGVRFGEVRVFYPEQQPLEMWQINLLHSLADQIAIALSLSNQLNQQRRIALLDERAIIARELHDSLAQSLSYLKIQVARIEKGMQGQMLSEAVTTPVSELKEGLISAYRQLRELLTTFRLQIGSEGLQAALTQTIQTLAERSPVEIHLHYDCSHVPFEPNEEIHLLQITKEALQNALNHSQGTKVTVSLVEQADKSVTLLVKDNGIGLRQTRQELNHYGTEIMQERCHSLNGRLDMTSPSGGGTEVRLSFRPDYLNKQVDILLS